MHSTTKNKQVIQGSSEIGTPSNISIFIKDIAEMFIIFTKQKEPYYPTHGNPKGHIC